MDEDQKQTLLQKRLAKKKQLAGSLFSGGGMKFQKNQMQKQKFITTDEPIEDGNQSNMIHLSQSKRPKVQKFAKNKFESKYDLGEKLGEGAHGLVRKCKKKSDGKQYAVKIVRSNDEEIMISIKNCYQLQKKVQKHHLMCKTFELFIDEQSETIFQVMELISYPSLHSFAKNYPNNQIPVDISQVIIKQLCESVRFMHEQGICHRDLKPDNIMIDQNNQYAIKIIDFGIARKFLQKDPSNKYNTLRNDMWSRTGTLCYKAPEMFASAAYTESCDMWSVGVIAYEILLGKLPFYREYQTDTIECIEECNYKFYDVGNFEWKKNTNPKDFIRRILKTIDNKSTRLSPSDALKHPWLSITTKKNPKSVRDDQDMVKSYAKNGFELGKSTGAWEMQQLAFKNKKFGNGSGQFKDNNNSNTNNQGGQNLQNQNQNLNNNAKQNQNFMNNTNSINSNNNVNQPNIKNNNVPINNSQGAGMMTMSQIQILKDEDIHVFKQPLYGFGLMNNNSDMSNNGQKTPDLQLSRCISRETKITQEDIDIMEKKQKKSSEEDILQMMLAGHTRQPSTSISFNINPGFSNNSPDLKPQKQNSNSNEPASILTKYNEQEMMVDSVNPYQQQDENQLQQQQLNFQKNNNNSSLGDSSSYMSSASPEQRSSFSNNNSTNNNIVLTNSMGNNSNNIDNNPSQFKQQQLQDENSDFLAQNQNQNQQIPIRNSYQPDQNVIQEEDNDDTVTSPGNQQDLQKFSDAFMTDDMPIMPVLSHKHSASTGMNKSNQTNNSSNKNIQNLQNMQHNDRSQSQEDIHNNQNKNSNQFQPNLKTSQSLKDKEIEQIQLKNNSKSVLEEEKALQD